MRWDKLNKLRAIAMLLEAKKLVGTMEGAADGMPRDVSLFTALGITEKISQADGIVDFWAHVMRVLLSNGAMAPGGQATVSAQEAYCRLLKRANRALGVMKKKMKAMDKQRLRAVRREAKDAAKKAPRVSVATKAMRAS